MATFCLLHGDWHDGSCWDPLVGPLRARGHDALAPDLPYDDSEAGFEARARPALAALEGVSDEIVIVGHSASSGYAAFVAPRNARFAFWSISAHAWARSRPPPSAPATFRKGFPVSRQERVRRHRLGRRRGGRCDYRRFGARRPPESWLDACGQGQRRPSTRCRSSRCPYCVCLCGRGRVLRARVGGT